MDNSTNPEALCLFCDEIPWIIFKITFGGIIIVLHIITLAALFRCRQLKMSLKYSFTNLSVTDLISGIMYVYYGIMQFFIHTSSLECKIRFWFVSMTSCVTLFTLSMLSLDRLLSLEFPLKYDTTITNKLLLMFTFISWMIAFVFVTPTVAMFREMTICNFVQVMTHDGYITYTCGGFLLITVILACHLRIFVLARRQISKILPTMLHGNRATAAIKLNMKTTVTTATVLVPFILLNIPIYVYFLCLSFESDVSSSDNALDIMDAVLFLQLLSSFLNPIIYAWRLPELRRHVRRMLSCGKSETETTNYSSSTEA
ncbi:adenosine receptor A2b-like [Haliotis cracherodii]|uniref:adenosine receptor A2b-like n=1 Tax=Haliotis cracherodii TaxID=6455 RepID=UPI0039EBBA02